MMQGKGHSYSPSDEIECPHTCGHVLRELWDYNWEGNSGSIITECSECLKPITLERRVSVAYYARADEVSP